MKNFSLIAVLAAALTLAACQNVVEKPLSEAPAQEVEAQVQVVESKSKTETVNGSIEIKEDEEAEADAEAETEVKEGVGYETMTITPEIIARVSKEPDTISTIPEETDRNAGAEINSETMLTALENVVGTEDLNNVAGSFQVSGNVIEYMHENIMGAEVYRGCMPASCSGMKATGIYVYNYLNDDTLEMEDEFFVLWQIGDEYRFYNTAEPSKQKMKDALLYWHLKD